MDDSLISIFCMEYIHWIHLISRKKSHFCKKKSGVRACFFGGVSVTGIQNFKSLATSLLCNWKFGCFGFGFTSDGIFRFQYDIPCSAELKSTYKSSHSITSNITLLLQPYQGCIDIEYFNWKNLQLLKRLLLTEQKQIYIFDIRHLRNIEKA